MILQKMTLMKSHLNYQNQDQKKTFLSTVQILTLIHLINKGQVRSEINKKINKMKKVT
jgi:cell division FtsZ-interacting protein ZapD